VRVTKVRSTSASDRVLFGGFRFGSSRRILKSQGPEKAGTHQMNVQSITAGDTLETQQVGRASPTRRWPAYGFAPGLGRSVKSPDCA
jgi:hypothetical protein